jgi:uncharacterized membrane protein YphA (DoxX/SURF4 family)
VPARVRIFGRELDGRWLSLVLRLLVGAVFVVSGLTKVVDIDATTRSVRAYRLLPEAIVPTVGSALPVLELALAVLLIGGLLTRFAAGLTAVVSAAFFIGVASAWARGLSIECGCFGNSGLSPHPVPGYVRELVLNGLIVLACSWLLRNPASRLSLDGVLGLRAVGDDAVGDFDDEAELEPDAPSSTIGIDQ